MPQTIAFLFLFLCFLVVIERVFLPLDWDE